MLRIMEFRRKIKALKDEGNNLYTKAEGEKRELSPEEVKRVEVINGSIAIFERDMDNYIKLNRISEEQLREIPPNKPSPEEMQLASVDPKGGFRSFGEFLKTILGTPNDSRLKALRTGMVEGTDTAGGFLVPTQFAAMILSRAIQRSAMRRLGAMVMPMSSDSLDIPKIVDTTHASSIHGGVIAYWLAEQGVMTPKEPTFGKVGLVAKTLTGYTYASNQLLADNAVGLEALLTRIFGDALAWFEDQAFISGNGVGKPLGFLSSGALLAINRSAATTVAAADIANLWARFGGDESNAGWIANRTVLAQLIKLSTTPITWLNSPGSTPNVAGKVPTELMGRPLVFSEHAKALGTAGDITLVDPSYYIIGDRQPITIAASEHVRFTTNETAWRFVERVDGQPWVDTAWTPANGSTLSPFVTLYTATTGGD